ncbi:MAG TPA: hypothetical protein VLB75_04815 [Steroidobacteraceae bacterium]|nr:hypothetical protein [Steroidobacteraceae bacterium]
MNSNASMTGTFRFQVPADLLSALKTSPVEDPGKGMEVHTMKPSFMERIWALFSRPRRGRR